MAPTYQAPGVYVEEVPPLARPIAGAGTSTPGFIGVIPDTVQIPAPTQASDSQADRTRGFKWVDVTMPPVPGSPPAGTAVNPVNFITTWSQYTKLFGDFVGDVTATPTTVTTPAINNGQRYLAQAVYGFFNNGGTGCYVTRVATEADLPKALTVFAKIDDISMVAAPGLNSTADYTAVEAHCALLEDRVAILDPVQVDAAGTAFAGGDFTALARPTTDAGPPPGLRPADSQFASFYFPWIQVFDPATQLMQPAGNGLIYVPPSGHIAGIWASTDASRGVFKAPANDPPLQGVTGLQWLLSTADQKTLNPPGVNLIRSLNGAIRVWGARTVGGDDNGDFKYLSTRRYFNYLRKSIENGTQWVVFEPNSTSLWQRIIRSVSDFLLNEWRNGALFGDTPNKAFFVRCNEDTNPPEVRDLGQVITEIGVAIVEPAEFVIFRIQQTTGG